METGALELLSPTRQVLVSGIKERGEATAEELAAASYLSVAAVRMHFAALERLGILTHSSRPRGPGRPQHIYRLTDAGEQLFPQGYSALLARFLEVLKTDPECAGRLWERIEARQAAELGAAVTSQDLDGRLAELVRARQLRSFSPCLRDLGEGSWAIEMHHCPLIKVAEGDRAVCAAEARVVQRVLGGNVAVTREGTRPDGHTVCSLRVTAAPAMVD